MRFPTGTAAAAVAVAIASLVAFADRPVALWCHAMFGGTAIEQAIILEFVLLEWLLRIGAVLFVVASITLRFRPDLDWLRRTVSAGAAAAVALLVAEGLKLAIGRTQPWPQFLGEGIYTLRPFGGAGGGFRSFPSATMAGVTAIIAGLGLRPPVERWLQAAAITYFAATLLIVSAHWTSDILGGSILGAVLGRQIARRIYPAP